MADKQIKIVMAINDKVTRPLRNIQKSFDNLSFVKSTVALKNAFSGIAKHSGLNKVASATSDLIGPLGKVKDEAFGAALKIGGLVGAGVGGMAALVKQTADYGSELIDVAKRIDFGVEAFQEYRYAAEQSGVSNEDFVKGTEKFTRSLGEAKTGQGALFSFLKATNPELLKQVLHAKTTEESFGLVTKSLGGVKDASKQAMYANLLFGKSGKNFVNLANAGGDGIDKLRQRARALGLVMSEVDAGNAEEFGDKWSTVSQVFVGIRNSIALKLMPALGELMGKFMDWAANNQAKIQEFATMLGDKLPEVIKSIKDGFDSFMDGPIVGFLKWLGDTFGYLNVALVAVAAVIFGPLIASMAALIPLVWSLGVALLTTPIGWIIGGIVLLVGVFYGLYKGVEWAMEGIMKIMKPVFNWILDGIEKLANKFSFLKKIIPTFLTDGSLRTDIKVISDNNYKDRQNYVTPVSNGEQRGFLDTHHAIQNAMGGNTSQTIKNYVQAQQGVKNETAVKVSFDNLPKGAKVETQASKGVDLSTDARMGMLGLPSF